AVDFFKVLIKSTINFKDLNTPIILHDRLVEALKIFSFEGFSPNPKETAFFIRLLLKRSLFGSGELDTKEKFQNALVPAFARLTETPWWEDEGEIPPNLISIDSLLDPQNRTPFIDYLWEFWVWVESSGVVTVQELSSNPLIVETTALRFDDLVVCFLGLVTNSQEYEHFFSPVKIDSPFPVPGSPKEYPVNRMLSELKGSGACDLIGAVTHLSDHSDMKLIENADDGIDFVMGGHSHNFWNNPPLWAINKQSKKQIPIFKSGEHGGAFITFDVTINSDESKDEREVTFNRFKTIEITSQISSDPIMSAFIEKTKENVTDILGFDLFSVVPVKNSISLERLDRSESPFSNFVLDCVRDRLWNKADFIFLSPMFIHGDIPNGEITSAELFSILPLVYDSDTKKTWDISTIEVSGQKVITLLETVFGRNHMMAVDRNVRISFDPSDAINPFRTIEIRQDEEWSPLDPHKIYKIAVPAGVLYALKVLGQLDSDIYAERIDYPVDLWQLVRDKLIQKKELTRYDRIDVDQRISPIQSDLASFRQNVALSQLTNTGLYIFIDIHNNGQQNHGAGEIVVKIDTTPENLFDNGGWRFKPRKPSGLSENPLRDEQYKYDMKIFSQRENLQDSMQTIATRKLNIFVKPGEWKTMNIFIPLDEIHPFLKENQKLYPVEVLIKQETPEWVTENNRVESFLLLQ
ncbi:5'-nucleotidase C-terminal domain-containing protein, partial [Bdellovibrionota bacterium]